MLYVPSSLTLKESHHLQYVSDFFGIPLCYRFPDAPFFLTWYNQRIELTVSGYKYPVVVDFANNRLLRRSQHNQGEFILKAVNLKKYSKIWDVTAGLGKDAFVLASFGAEVTLFERHPLIAALLWDGLKRAQQNQLLASSIERMHFVYGSVLDETTIPTQLPQVIYLDPMFPARNKSAGVKKDMIFLKEVVGEDSDDVKLFNKVQTLNVPRIVVKRSKLAPNISGTKANFSVRGQSTRFDIYLPTPNNDQKGTSSS